MRAQIRGWKYSNSTRKHTIAGHTMDFDNPTKARFVLRQLELEYDADVKGKYLIELCIQNDIGNWPIHQCFFTDTPIIGLHQ